MNLIGIHDREAAHFTPPDTWILDTVSLASNQQPLAYDTRFHWITRINWGYGSTGTLPALTQPDRVQLFFERLRDYVARSSGCKRWIIGNEPNLPREWPDSQPIYPAGYAKIFHQARQLVRGLPGHDQDEVLVAAPGPWNNQLQYPGNDKGDWVRYFLDQIDELDGDFDGFAFHTYTHGYDPRLVWSEATMNAPFQDRYYEFFSYKNFLNVIPDRWAQLPMYITEANGNGPWQATGLMRAMADEVAAHNARSAKRKIKCLIFFRYPNFSDGYHIEGKQDVMNEYLDTVRKNYQSPVYLPLVVTPSNPSAVTDPYPNAPKTTVKAVQLNVRDKPGTTDSTIIDKLSQGEKISILEERVAGNLVWYRIGEGRWVAAEWTDKPSYTSYSQSNLWERVKAFTLNWEGGYQNLHWDLGNWTGCQVGVGQNKGTKYGISACAYPNLDIQNITREQAEKIYYEDYWIRSGASQESWPMCLLVFDSAVNFGASVAAAWLKQSKGNIMIYTALRLRGYRKSQSWPQAGNAWIDRTIDLLLEAGEG